jgi:hypothetical protein
MNCQIYNFLGITYGRIYVHENFIRSHDSYCRFFHSAGICFRNYLTSKSSGCGLGIILNLSAKRISLCIFDRWNRQFRKLRENKWK